MKNQKGFSLVETLLIILILTVVGFGGYLVWSNNQGNEQDINESAKTETTPTQETSKSVKTDKGLVTDKTTDWTTFRSSAGWSVRIPDGWDTSSINDNKELNIIKTPKYLEGTPATITVPPGGRGGPFALFTMTFEAGETLPQIPEYLTEESDFTTTSVNGTRYSGTLNQDYLMNGTAGDTIYWYVLSGGTRTVIFTHNDFSDPNSEEVLKLLEQSLSTLKFD